MRSRTDELKQETYRLFDNLYKDKCYIYITMAQQDEMDYATNSGAAANLYRKNKSFSPVSLQEIPLPIDLLHYAPAAPDGETQGL